jgi:hypothetical protein
MKYEYRLVSRFDGQWDLQTRPTKESWAKHYHKSDPDDWTGNWMYEWRGRYEEVVKRANRLIAEQDYVPAELTPPFPDKDPKGSKKKGWFW